MQADDLLTEARRLGSARGFRAIASASAGTRAAGLYRALKTEVRKTPTQFGDVLGMKVGVDGALVYDVVVTSNGRTGYLVKFKDGSQLVVDEDFDDSPALDAGPALLLEVTLAEHRGVETVLTELWRAIDDDTLTAGQAAQIQAMAQMIEVARRASIPEESKRWELVGAVKSGLRYLFKEVPKDALAWWKLAEILHGIQWHHLANEIGKQL